MSFLSSLQADASKVKNFFSPTQSVAAPTGSGYVPQNQNYFTPQAINQAVVSTPFVGQAIGGIENFVRGVGTAGADLAYTAAPNSGIGHLAQNYLVGPAGDITPRQQLGNTISTLGTVASFGNPAAGLTENIANPLLKAAANQGVAALTNTAGQYGNDLSRNGLQAANKGFLPNLAGNLAAGAVLHGVANPGETFSGAKNLAQEGKAAANDFKDNANLRQATSLFDAPLEEPSGQQVSVMGQQPQTVMQPVEHATAKFSPEGANELIRSGGLNDVRTMNDPTVNMTTPSQNQVLVHYDPKTGKALSIEANGPFKKYVTEAGNTQWMPKATDATPEQIDQAQAALKSGNVKFRTQDPQAAAAAQNASDVPLTTDLPENTGTGSGVKERAFVSGAKTSPDVSSEAKSQLEGDYVPRSNAELTSTVQRRIEADPQAAHDFALNNNTDEGTATAIQLAAKYRDAGQHDLEASLINAKAKQLTEAGRTIQAAKLLARQSPEAQAVSAARSIQAFNEANPAKKIPELTGAQTKAISERAQAIQEMPKETSQQQRDAGLAQQKLWEDIADLTPSKFSDKFLAIRRAGLLTGPQTIGKVLASHGIYSAMEQASKAVGSGIDSVVGKFTGQRALTNTGEGLLSGAKQGFQEGKDLLVRGYDPEADFDRISKSRVNFGTSKVGKAAQAYVDSVGRTHASLPKAGYQAAYRNSLADQAYAAGKTQGLTGTDAEKFVSDFKANPSDAAQQTATNDAKHATFANETALGNGAKAIQNAKGLGPVAKFLIPFSKVPASIATAVHEYSPTGAVETIFKAIKAGDWTPEVQRQFSQGLGRSIVGTGILAAGLELGKKGLISGSYPSDAKTRAQWSLEGKQENSILLNGKWRDLGSLGPAGTAIQIGASLAQGLKGNLKKPGTIVNAALAAAAQGGSELANQPYIQGISSLADTLKDPQRSAETFAKSSATSLIPTAVATAARAADPLQRSAPDVGTALASKIPGLREQLQPQQTAFGQDLQRQGTVAENVLDPTRPTYQQQSPLINNLSALTSQGYSATPTGVQTAQTVGGKKVQLTPQQQYALNAQGGPQIQAAFQQIMADPSYSQASPDQQQSILDNAASNIRALTVGTNAGSISSGQVPQGGAQTGSTAQIPASVTSPGAASGFYDPNQSVSANAQRNLTPAQKQAQAAQVTLAKDQVASGTKDSVQIGDTLVTKDDNGNVVTKSVTSLQAASDQAQYQLQLYEAQQNKDYSAYQTLQNQQLQTLQAQMQTLQQNPSINGAAIATNQKSQETIRNALSKYQSYGGSFTKPKAGTKPRKPSAGRLSTTVKKTTGIKAIKVAGAGKSQVKALKGTAPKKKSLKFTK